MFDLMMQTRSPPSARVVRKNVTMISCWFQYCRFVGRECEKKQLIIMGGEWTHSGIGCFLPSCG